MDAAHLQPQDLQDRTPSGHLPARHLLVVPPHRIVQVSRGGAAPEHTDVSPPTSAVWLGPLRMVSFAGLSVFVLAILVLHGLQANLNPAEHTISEYSLGSYGWLMRTAFLALGLGTLTTAASLRLSCRPSELSRIGVLLLGSMAFGLFLDAGFNTDHPRVPETVDGTVHSVGTWILALALPGAAFVFGSDFVRHSISTKKATLLLVLGAAQLGAIVLFEMSPTTVRGWAERLVTVLAVIALGLLQVLARANAQAADRGRLRTTTERARSSVFRPFRQAIEPHRVA